MTYRRLRCLFMLIALAAVFQLSCGDSEQAAVEAPAKSFTMIAADSISALDLVVAEHHVVYTSSSMGAFVTEIDSIAGGDNGYWMYKVNDTMVPTASDKMILQPGDTLTWFLHQPGQ